MKKVDQKVGMTTANTSVGDCKSTRRALRFEFEPDGIDGCADQPANPDGTKIDRLVRRDTSGM